jgi:CRP-like cAMP-binding protein
MESILLPAGKVLYRTGEPPEYAHFMTSGLASIVILMTDGANPEVALIGREGLVEGYHLLGQASVPSSGVVRIEGSALRIPFVELQKHFASSQSLHRRILESIQIRGLVGSQVAACNRLHGVEERLARRLLIIADLLSDSAFYLTHEALAEMMGVQRTTVTQVAGSFQSRGLITYSRGHIHIVDRKDLESVACECYPIIRNLIFNLYQPS